MKADVLFVGDGRGFHYQALVIGQPTIRSKTSILKIARKR
jgi:hypothetical protein